MCNLINMANLKDVKTDVQDVASIIPFGDLEQRAKELIEAASKAREFAYCPFSKFAVGAAVAWEDSDEIDSGANIENSSYGNSICAERSAASKGISHGKRKLKAVAVVAEMTDSSEYVSPCGICRQFLFEFGDTTEIYLSKPSNIHGNVLVTSIKSILPLGFRLPSN